jgi:hypothetical protein
VDFRPTVDLFLSLLFPMDSSLGGDYRLRKKAAVV